MRVAGDVTFAKTSSRESFDKTILAGIWLLRNFPDHSCTTARDSHTVPF